MLQQRYRVTRSDRFRPLLFNRLLVNRCPTRKFCRDSLHAARKDRLGVNAQIQFIADNAVRFDRIGERPAPGSNYRSSNVIHPLFDRQLPLLEPRLGFVGRNQVALITELACREIHLFVVGVLAFRFGRFHGDDCSRRFLRAPNRPTSLRP